MEELLATRSKRQTNPRQARTCHRAGARGKRHQPVVYTLSRTFKRLPIRHHVESGALFNADRNLRMDRVERGGLETLHCQSTTTRRCSSTSRMQSPKQGSSCGGWQLMPRRISCLQNEARKCNPYARSKQVSSDERSHKLVSCGGNIRPPRKGGERIHRPVSDEHGRKNGRGSLSRTMSVETFSRPCR